MHGMLFQHLDERAGATSVSLEDRPGWGEEAAESSEQILRKGQHSVRAVILQVWLQISSSSSIT